MLLKASMFLNTSIEKEKQSKQRKQHPCIKGCIDLVCLCSVTCSVCYTEHFFPCVTFGIVTNIRYCEQEGSFATNMRVCD